MLTVIALPTFLTRRVRLSLSLDAVEAWLSEISSTPGASTSLVNNLNDYPSLLRNQSPSTNSWLLVKLMGTKTNRAAIGSRVIVTANNRRQVQEVRSGGSFCSQNDLRLHFGLGAAKEARVQVRWLGGAEETLEHVPANRLVVIQEGKGIISQEAF